jgi:uracil-DNA glycosylase
MTSYFENEIEAIKPRHIVALGAAAWDACGGLSEKHGSNGYRSGGVAARNTSSWAAERAISVGEGH